VSFHLLGTLRKYDSNHNGNIQYHNTNLTLITPMLTFLKHFHSFNKRVFWINYSRKSHIWCFKDNLKTCKLKLALECRHSERYILIFVSGLFGRNVNLCINLGLYLCKHNIIVFKLCFLLFDLTSRYGYHPIFVKSLLMSKFLIKASLKFLGAQWRWSLKEDRH